MPNGKNDNTFQLIKSLTKAEKRNFRLYAKRTQSSSDQKFVQLFDAMDKASEYDEQMLLNKVPSISKGQFSNQKSNLYKVLLASIRSLHKSKADIQIRENIDYARLLYNKGLYMQSLKILEKTKAIAIKNYSNLLILEIVEFEKEIETRYITRSIKNRAWNLRSESRMILKGIFEFSELSNFSLIMYDRYLKEGFVKNEEEFNNTQKFFYKNLPDFDLSLMDFSSTLYYYQSHVWYYLIVQDFVMCYRYAKKWVELYERESHMIALDPDMYLKGLHNLLNALHHVGIEHYDRFKEALEKMEKFNEDHYESLNENSQLQTFLFLESNRINDYFMTGKFTEGTKMIAIWEYKINKYKDRLDSHRILVFYYKFASLLFGAGKHKECIKYLNRILSIEEQSLREDIQVYSRLLMLISHYELGNDDLLEYQVKSTFRFLAKQKELGEVHREIFKFLRKTPAMTRKSVSEEFKIILEKLKTIREHPFDKRPFLYLDLISWLQSKIEGIPVEKIIREKFLGKRELP